MSEVLSTFSPIFSQMCHWIIDLPLYEQRVRQLQHQIPLFFQPWWLDAACGPDHWYPLCHPTEALIWPVFLRQKGPFRYLTMPPLTPRLGTCPPQLPSDADWTELRRLFPGLIYCLQHFSTEIPPKRAENGVLTPRHHYSIERTGDTGILWDNTHTLARRHIRKSEQLLTLQPNADPDQLYALMQRSLARHGVSHLLSPARFRLMVEASLTAGQGAVWAAKDDSGQIHAAIWLVWDHQSVYYLAGGLDDRIRQVGASRWLLWKGMELAQGRRFDFGGGMSPSVGQVYASLGGQITPYTRMVWYPHPLVRKTVLQLKKWYAPHDSLYH